MAAMSESSPAQQFDRDFRSANQAWKRNKDSSAKWALGVRHLPGTPNWVTCPPEHPTKGRPFPKHSDSGHRSFKDRTNTIKTGHANWQQRNGRPRGKFGGQEEISDVSRSMADMLIPAARRESMLGSLDNVLYSFDRTESPGRPVTLEMFVKTGGRAARDTERLVESEYEILDGQGESLKGRRARRDLRKSAGTSSDAAHKGPAAFGEDDDFEFVDVM